MGSHWHDGQVTGPDAGGGLAVAVPGNPWPARRYPFVRVTHAQLASLNPWIPGGWTRWCQILQRDSEYHYLDAALQSSEDSYSGSSSRSRSRSPIRPGSGHAAIAAVAAGAAVLKAEGVHSTRARDGGTSGVISFSWQSDLHHNQLGLGDNSSVPTVYSRNYGHL